MNHANRSRDFNIATGQPTASRKTAFDEDAIDQHVKDTINATRCPKCGSDNYGYNSVDGATCHACGNHWWPPPPYAQPPTQASRRTAGVTNVSAWADGFGNWHARVETDGSVGDGNEEAAEAAALSRIRDELGQREGPGYAPEVVGVKLNHRDSQNGTLTFYYDETNAHEATKTAATDWGEGVVGKQLLGAPGSEITDVQPTADYLTNGPRGDYGADMIVTVRYADGHEGKLPKSYEWLQKQKGGSAVTSASKPHVDDGFIRHEGAKVRAFIDGKPLTEADDEMQAERALAMHMGTTGAWKPVWAVTGSSPADYDFDLRIVSAAHYAAMKRTAAEGEEPEQWMVEDHGTNVYQTTSEEHARRQHEDRRKRYKDEHQSEVKLFRLKREAGQMVKVADDNPFAKKDDKPKDDSGGDDAAPATDAPAAGDALDPTQMQPGQKVTLNYTLTGANPGNGATEATFDSTDGTSFFFTYSKGRFAVTQQGDKWVDSVGTEFTFDAADDAVPDPAQAIDPATQAPAAAPQPTASLHEDEPGLFRRFVAWARGEGLSVEANPYTDSNPYQTGPSMQDAAPGAPNAAPQAADTAAPNPQPAAGDPMSTRPRQMPSSPQPAPAAPQAPMQPQVGTPGGPGTTEYGMGHTPDKLFNNAALDPPAAWTPRMVAAYYRDLADRLEAQEA